MRETIGIFRYEYLMQIRRPGLWISLFVTVGVFLFLALRTLPSLDLLFPGYTTNEVWKLPTILIEAFNLFTPIAAGILSADRFTRDRLLGTSELINCALLSRLPLVLGKYAGSLLAIFTPPFVLLVGALAYLAAYFHQPALLLTAPVVLLAVVLPAWLFVVAWSLIFPLVMPLRLYQVLFAGFWMWAVAVPPDRLPTINQSILSVNGQYARYLFFLDQAGSFFYMRPPPTIGWTIINMALIVGLSVAAVALIPLVLRRQEAAQ